MFKKKASKEIEVEQSEVIAPEQRRNELIVMLRGLLLTKREMWQGGRLVRTRAAQESISYQPVIDEINQLGRPLDEPDVSIGSLRRD